VAEEEEEVMAVVMVWAKIGGRGSQLYVFSLGSEVMVDDGRKAGFGC
jgi:hypothetical protein